MRIYVFTGPSLSVQVARLVLDAIYLPPASQGDVYAAARERPWAIGIIDGYFERVPAVWHKEILWALAEGVHVFGSASMGALRAAELYPFGMEGVGRIFDSFRDGELEDDDEVTVVHGPAEQGFPLLSEPMVNIRFTFAAAEKAGAIGAATRQSLVAIAKELFYPDRDYPRILEKGIEQGLPAQEMHQLTAWLPQGRVDQKRDDALAMLHQIRQRCQTDPAPKRVRFIFQQTDAWEQVRRQMDRRPLDSAPGADTYQHDAVLDELRLQGDLFREVCREVLLRALALALARQEDWEVGDAPLIQTVDEFRRERGLLEPDEVQNWLDDQSLNLDEFTRLMTNETRVRRIRTMFEAEITRDLPGYLRQFGMYKALAERARKKQELLASSGLENPSLVDVGLSEAGLWQWFFRSRGGEDVPLDLAAFAATAGFDTAAHLKRAALREFAFLRLEDKDPPAGRSATVDPVEDRERGL